MDGTSWLLFFAGLTNQMGRVMIPAIKTSVMADPDFGPSFAQNVGTYLSGVSIVCLAGKILGGAVTDRLGGWAVLVSVFAIWIVVTFGAIFTSSVQIFGAMWLLNSLAYTVTWGAQVQVIGVSYSETERPGQLSSAASSSRVGATLGNIVFGQLLTAGLHWRTALMPMVPLQIILGVLCVCKWSASSKAAEQPAANKGGTKSEAAVGKAGKSPQEALFTLDFWLLLIPKAVTFTYTQFFMNYIPQLLHVRYGYSHGAAASLGGVAQGGSVVGLMILVPMFYKKAGASAKAMLVAAFLAVSTAVPAVLAFSSSLPVDITPLVVPLTMLWGTAYVIPFYLPCGEYAMSVGGKKYTGMYANIFDGAGFVASALWNPWASASSKGGDFSYVLLSQAAFGAIGLAMMPLGMHYCIAKEAGEKKQA